MTTRGQLLAATAILDVAGRKDLADAIWDLAPHTDPPETTEHQEDTTDG